MKLTRKVANLATTLITFGSLAGGANAATIIGASSVISNTGFFGNGLDLINQSGLSATYASGITNFSSFVATTTSSSTNIGDGGVFGGSSVATNIWTFDLGSEFNLEGVAVFSLGSSPGRVTEYNVHFDSNSIFSDGVTSSPALAVLIAGHPSPTVSTFPSAPTQFVHIESTNTERGIAFHGLGEVFFSGTAVPEPSSALLLGLGALTISFRRRR